MMEFILYQVYVRMIKNRDGDPFFRAFAYINVIVFLLLLSLSIFLQKIIEFLYNKKVINFILKENLTFEIILLFIFAVIISYFKFFYKKQPEYYINKFKNHFLNEYFSSFLFLFLLPILCLSIGPILAVILFGGVAFGNEIKGLLNF